MEINSSTNIDITNNHLSPTVIKKPNTYGIGNISLGMKRTHTYGEVILDNGIQTSTLDTCN